MGDNRVGHSNRNHLFDVGPNSRVDLFLRSESPRVQQVLLHQKLKEEIEKNASEQVRYVDSELYRRSNIDRSPASSASEVQSTTLNIGMNSNNKQSNSRKATSTFAINKNREDITPGSSTAAATAGVESVDSSNGNQRHENINRNCQVCLIKEVRQDLVNINKIVQERNEQISKLKAKCLRSYFERQMMD